MKRMLSTCLLAWIGLVVTLPATAQNSEYLEGAHYELLEQAQPIQTGDQIEVVEMFWYRCPHCYRLEPYLEKWQDQKPEYAEFVPIPAVLADSWIFHAKVYYTFEALGLTQALHKKFFDAIHKDRIRFTTPEALADWVAEQGIDDSSILATFNSFAVDNKVNFAGIMTRNYGISGVPSIIVDGKYRTSVSLAGSHNALVDIINFLVEKAAAERQS